MRRLRKRYKHDISQYHNKTMAMGTWDVLDMKEMLGGETYFGNTEAVIRTMPMVGPTMHPIRVKIVHGFCPTRLIWEDFEAFITNGEYGSTPPVHPTVALDASNAGIGSLSHSIHRCPLENAETATWSVLPFRAYQKFVTDWLIDQDLSTKPTISLASGTDSTTTLTGAQCCWKKDYFTTARPWPQKGAAVPIPADNNVQIESDGNAIQVRTVVASPSTDRNLYGAAVGTNPVQVGGADITSDDNLKFGTETGLQVDVGDAMGTIDDLSVSVALQRFLRNRAKWGSRLTEYLKQSFGVNAQDSRLQRSEFISQGQKTLQFSEVLQTAEGADPVGTLKGHGIGGLGSNTFKYYAQEPGFFFTLISIMPEPIYMRAVPKFAFKRTFEDYFQPEFKATGQMPILKGEINGKAGDVVNNETWAWNDPYDDYRFAASGVSGLMYSTYKDWHVARDGAYTLNDAFIRELPSDRIFASGDPDSFQVFAFNKVIKRSPVPRRVVSRIL